MEKNEFYRHITRLRFLLFLMIVGIFFMCTQNPDVANADSIKIGIKTAVDSDCLPTIKTGLTLWNPQKENVVNYKSDNIFLVKLPDNTEGFYVYADYPEKESTYKKFYNYHVETGYMTLRQGTDSSKYVKRFRNVQDKNLAISGEGALISVEELFKGNDQQEIDKIIKYRKQGYQLLFVCSSLGFEGNKNTVAFIILARTRTETNDKTALKQALDRIPDPEKDELYYHENDRYRGNEYPYVFREGNVWEVTEGYKYSRWDKFLKARKAAQAEFDNPDALSMDITKVTKDLNEAVDNLFPKSEINATILYEKYKKYSAQMYWAGYRPSACPSSNSAAPYTELTEQNTTPESLKRFKDSIPTLKELLDKLYDADGRATDENKSSNAELIKQIDDAVKESDDAFENLDRIIFGPTDIDIAISKYQRLQSLGGGLYDVSKLNKEDFTEESYEALKKACDATREYCDEYGIPVFGISSFKEYKKIEKLYDDLIEAYYHLRDKKETITIKLRYLDTAYRTYDSKRPLYHIPIYREEERILGEKRNYKDVAGNPIPEIFGSQGSPDDQYIIFINGIMVAPMELRTPTSSLNMETTAWRKNICFRDQDEVIIARLNQPTKLGSSTVGYDPYEPLKVEPHIKVSRMSVPKEIVQGEEVEFTFEVAAASVMNAKRGKYIPMSGAELIRSANAVENKDDILFAQTVTGVKTDLNGKLKYRFLDPGYYRISINPPVGGDADYMPGLTCPAVAEIYVKPTSEENIDKVRKTFLAELKNAYERYPHDSYDPESLAELKGFYESGITAVKNAEKLIDAQSEMKSAVEKIYKLQEKVLAANDEKVRDFLLKLAPMPGDASKFDKGQIHLMKPLVEAFNEFSDYQKSLLSTRDKDKYEAIKLAYGKDGSNLPAPKKYKLSWKIVGDNEADTKVLEKLLKLYLEDENKTGITPLRVYRDKLFFKGHVSERFESPIIKYVKTEAYPLEKFVITSIYFAIPKYADKVEGAEYDSGKLKINGKEYGGMEVSYANALKLSHEEGKGQNAKIITNTYMPYEDLEITLVCSELQQQHDGDVAKRKKVIDNLESQFLRYHKDDYTDENWAKLVKIKDDSVKEIENLTILYYIDDYYEKAVRAMAAVPRKTNTWNGTNTDENISDVKVPDYGKTVGRVHVIVENQTFKDKSAAWHGRLIDGWYELEERDTMMTTILKALQKKGCHWSTGSQGNATSWDDYGIAYLASIKISEKTKGDGSDFVVNNASERLGEFSGEAGSGWMGTLNDWFTNEGFSQFGPGFSDSFKKIMDGDEIHVMFTQNLGVDLGGTWGNSDTRLKALQIEGEGTLSPAFSPNVKEYVYALKSGETSERIRVTPTAMNKNYLVGVGLNQALYGSKYTEYRRYSYIPVNISDSINIVIGSTEWPSMNKQGAEARKYEASKYTVKVVRSLTDYLNSKIIALPSSKRLTLANYVEYRDEVNGLLKTYENMSKEDQAKIKNMDVLREFINRAKFFEEINVVKDKLKKLPDAKNMSDAEVKETKNGIEDADRAYRALTDEQKKYIVIADVANYNKLVERLGKLKVSTSAKSINANEQAPVSPVVEPKAEVTGDKASAKLDEKAVNQVITEAAKTGEKKIIIEPQGTKDAKEINVSIPKASAEMLVAKKDMSVSVETKSGQVNIPAQAMASIVKEAKGSDISINIALKEKSAVKDVAALKLMENKDAVAVEIKIESANKGITKFASPIEILLPVNDKFKEGKAYPVTQISADGTKSNPIGKCVKIGGKLYIKLSTDHLSIFVVSPDAVSDVMFTDVQGHWAYEAIKYAFDNKLMNGVSTDKFNPNGTLSRAMLTTILYRIEKEPKVAEATKYKDVEQGKWYTDAIAWASHEGIVTGYSKDTFAPNDNITREQMAAMLQRYNKYKKLDVTKSKDLASYKDMGEISTWAVDSMKWAGAEGLVNGRTADSIVPKGTATRAEAATILKRYMENILKSKPAEKKADDKAKADSKTKAAS